MVDRRLGRGLDFFLSGGRQTTPTPAPVVAAQTPAAGEHPREETLQIEVNRLVPSPNQPRREFGEAELQELAGSVKQSGVLQPILARRVGEQFEIVAGERRWRAAKLAQLDRVPVLVKPITDEESAVFGLVENLQRADLNAIEKAAAFKQLVDRFQCSQDEVARKVGLDRSSVANFLRLLELPTEVQAHVSRGTLSMGHARALLGLVNKEDLVRVADAAIRDGLSVRAVEALVKTANLGPVNSGGKELTTKKARPVWLNELEENLVDSLGTKVTIRYGRKRSQIVIECAGRDEFERVYGKLKG